MSTPHPTSAQIERYRNRSATAQELIWMDSHISECDRCHAALSVDPVDEIVLALPMTSSSQQTDHLTYDEMEQWVDGRLSGVEREIVEEHIAECGRCREELGDLNRDSEVLPMSIESARASRTKRWLLPAAAMVVLVAGGIWFLSREDSSPHVALTSRVSGTRPPVVQPESTDTAGPLQAHLEDVRRGARVTRPDMLDVLAPGGVALRSESGAAAFSLVEPSGTLVRDERPAFRWKPVRGASSYSIAVIDVEKGEIAGSGATTRTSWKPAEPLERGRTYSWEVTAKIDDRVVRAPRPPAPEALFTVATTDRVEELDTWLKRLQNDHIALGILLAERGFLDDAERELELAVRAGDERANELLREIRSWRRQPAT